MPDVTQAARYSIIVPSYQRGRVAAQTIAALAAIDEPVGGFEVVVIDDGSAPEHVAELERAVQQHGRFRLLRRANGGPSAARNTGIGATGGEFVVFLDDDCAPRPDWLVTLVRPFDGGDPGLGAVGGRVAPAPPRNWVQRFCAAIEYATGEQPVFENASTQNACYRRSVLVEVGAFDEGFRHPGGDDPDLSKRALRAGYRLAYVPDAVVYHHELETYGDFLRHMYHRGLGEARIGRKFGRRRRVATRLALWPGFLVKIAVRGWRRTSPKGPMRVRILWALLEQTGYLAFLAGTAVGLWRTR
jgi:GT2 family glycosyltransferase